ncbi:MAG: vWA domain-containing protein [Thermoplasmata archaeon]
MSRLVKINICIYIVVFVLFISVALVSTTGAGENDVLEHEHRVGPYFDMFLEGDRDRVWPIQENRQPDEIEMSLSFQATGERALKFDPQDTIMVVDFSQGSATWDPDHVRIEATQAYVENMVPPDRAGALKLASNATLIHPLSEDYESVKKSLKMAQEPGGRTNYEEAIYKAAKELIDRGDPDKQRMQIFLSDGYPTYNVTAETMEMVKENNITIVTIGIGEDVNEPLLRWMANITSGEYYYVQDADQLVETYLKISDQFYTNETGKDIVVRSEFEDHILVNTNTFSITPDNITGFGDQIVVEWILSKTMQLGDSWEVKFNISTTKRGHQSVFTDTSGLYYTKPWNEEANFTSLPPHTIYGIIQTAAPPPPPPPPPAAAPPPPPPEIFPMPSPPLGTASLVPQASLQPITQTTGYQALFAPFIGLGIGEALKDKADIKQKEGIKMRAGKDTEEKEEKEQGTSFGHILNKRR